MELSSSIDFYMPCSLVILTYVKTGKLLTPQLTPLTKTLQVATKAVSQCCTRCRIRVTRKSDTLSRFNCFHFELLLFYAEI
jgi:hypothetical protein